MASAEKPLKDQNRPALLCIVIANALVLYLATEAQSIGLGGFAALLNSSIALVPAAGAFLVTSVLTELLDSTTKARLVFWRWRDPLPGSRAFSKLSSSDPRIDLRALQSKIGSFPSAARDQNSLWYRLYLRLAADPRVTQVHRNYLFARDYTALSAIFFIVGGALSSWLVHPIRLTFAYVAFLLVQYLVVRLAAKNNGERFVTTVLALTAAGYPTSF